MAHATKTVRLAAVGLAGFLGLAGLGGCADGAIPVQVSGAGGDSGDDSGGDASEPPPTFDVQGLSRDSVISIARASVGYTYWWGHGSLGGTTSGSCTGSCPSCTHTGAHGADCSGFVGKAWMLPEALPIVGADEHPFSTYTFVNAQTHWKPIARSAVQRGDAMVHNTGGAGHIFLYEKDDPWGSMWTYEARGCATGIVHNIRTASSAFGAIRRDGL